MPFGFVAGALGLPSRFTTDVIGLPTVAVATPTAPFPGKHFGFELCRQLESFSSDVTIGGVACGASF